MGLIAAVLAFTLTRRRAHRGKGFREALLVGSPSDPVAGAERKIRELLVLSRETYTVWEHCRGLASFSWDFLVCLHREARLGGRRCCRASSRCSGPAYLGNLRLGAPTK